MIAEPVRGKPCAHLVSVPDSDDITLAVAGTASIRAKAETLFGENYARLQKLKKEYDPDLVFFKWSPIMPEA